MRWEVVLERKTRNRLNDDITRKKLKAIAAAAERNSTFGFVGRVGKLGEPTIVVDETHGEVNRYLVRLRLEKTNVRKEEAAQNQYRHVLGVVKRCAESHGWTVIEDPRRAGEGDGNLSREALVEAVRPPRPEFRVPELTEAARADLLAGIYDRDSHVRVIHDSVTNYFESLRMHARDPRVEICRSHVLLKGKPAGCKTKLFERLKEWYERGGTEERVMFVDAHTMTKAGLENYLLDQAESGTLPEILVLEEIEKQSPDNLLSLVSVMGSGYVAKMNARIGRRREIANVLIWATCNDEEVIRKFRAGVLWSRFVHRLHCTRPSRDLMKRILADQVARMNGNQLWVDKAMEFAYELYPKLTGAVMDDPREVKGVLDGRDRLIDGTYQMDLISILRSQLGESPSKTTG